MKSEDMNSEYTVINAVHMLIHRIEDSRASEENIIVVETIPAKGMMYQLQICLVPPKEQRKKGKYSIETALNLDDGALVDVVDMIRLDEGLGKNTDIIYSVQYIFIKEQKYELQARMTSSDPQMILFDQWN